MPFALCPCRTQGATLQRLRRPDYRQSPSVKPIAEMNSLDMRPVSHAETAESNRVGDEIMPLRDPVPHSGN